MNARRQPSGRVLLLRQEPLEKTFPFARGDMLVEQVTDTGEALDRHGSEAYDIILVFTRLEVDHAEALIRRAKDLRRSTEVMLFGEQPFMQDPGTYLKLVRLGLHSYLRVVPAPERLRHMLEETLRRQTVSYELRLLRSHRRFSNDIFTDLDLRKVAKKTIRFLPNILSVEKVSIGWHEDEENTGRMTLFDSSGRDALEIDVTSSSIIGYFQQERHPIFINDADLFLRGLGLTSAARSSDEYRTQSFIYAPLLTPIGLAGCVCLSDPVASIFSRQDIETLEHFTQTLALVIKNGLSYQQIVRLAMTDELTGLYSQKYFFKRVQQDVAEADVKGRALSMLFIDLDGLKHCNDTHGHAVGNEALTRVGEVINRSTREAVDYAYRLRDLEEDQALSTAGYRVGGDEFVVLLLDTPYEKAQVVARRVRQNYDALAVGGTSLSIGVVERRPGERALDFLKRADEEMYREKRARRVQRP